MGLAANPRLWGYTDFLATFADRTELATQNPIHQVYLPVGYLSLLHAIRVSHATRQVGGGSKSRLNVYQSVLLNQILLFGGVILSSVLLALPCPVLASGQTMLLYAGTHLVLSLSGLGDVLLRLNANYAVGLSMDLGFAALDGIFRADGVLSLGVDLTRTHASPLLSTSPLAAILNGAIIGGATPLLIDLLRLDSPTGDWGIRPPRWIKNPLADTQDLLSAALVSSTYLLLTDPTLASTLTPYSSTLVGVLGLDVGSGVTDREARTVCAILMVQILLAQRLAAVPDEVAAPSKTKAVRAGGGKANRAASQNGDASVAVDEVGSVQSLAVGSTPRKAKKAKAK